ncbi:MAG TPA: hypothetical protein VFG54_05485 [Prolixibacteraceae bacterium]|nr:hypothetical protein [Prolixibacteraceae bacterium]
MRNPIKDQKYEPVDKVQPLIHGSQPDVSNHDEEGSSSESEMANHEYAKSVSDASKIKQPIRGTQQNQDIENDFSSEYQEDDYDEQGLYTSRSQLNEMEDWDMISKVEGDDEDILDETENARRNQQRMREAGSNKDKSTER